MASIAALVNISHPRFLCELASLNFDFASEIQAFWDLIGLPDWWKDFLRKISEASRKAQRIQALSITAGARAQGSEDTVIVNNPARSEIYKFYKLLHRSVSNRQSNFEVQFSIPISSDNVHLSMPSTGADAGGQGGTQGCSAKAAG